jgi:NAD+ kinase
MSESGERERPVSTLSLYVDSFSPPYSRMVKSLVHRSGEAGLRILVSTSSAAVLEEYGLDTGDDADVGLVLGGDGTILRGMDFYRDRGMPVLGINTGHLGFLASAELEEAGRALQWMAEGSYGIEELPVLSALMPSGQRLTAVNDFCVNRSMMGGILHFTVEVEREPVARVAGDGLVVSTPLGSTAYALSAGGPIMDPEIPGMLIVAICPHQISIRPIVVPRWVTIDVTVDGLRGAGPFVSADGKPLGSLQAGQRLRVSTSEEVCRVIRFRRRNDYYSRLGRKLGWGVRG